MVAENNVGSAEWSKSSIHRHLHNLFASSTFNLTQVWCLVKIFYVIENTALHSIYQYIVEASAFMLHAMQRSEQRRAGH